MSDEIIWKQLKLQRKISENHSHDSVNLFACKTNEDVVTYIKQMQFFLHQEIIEIMETIGGREILKPWSVKYKLIADQNFTSTAEVREEAMDALAFMLNICLAVGITADNIEEEFDKVYSKNMKRQDENY
jgi:NTP pyrophosphatase (non-canonical NTP hydrolase)